MSTFASIQPRSVPDFGGDLFEREADSVADRLADANGHSVLPVSRVHRGAEAPQIVRQALNSPGQYLDASTRAAMEPRLGLDLSRVRIHADANAAESARAISAKAFTSGTSIVFGAGQYRPETAEGRRLLAHELTHVAQQRGGTSVVQRQVDEKQRPRNWGTAPAIVKVEARHRFIGPGVGRDANGEITPIEIVKNTLEPGRYTLSDVGAAKGPSDADYVVNQSPRFAFRHPVANMHPNVRVTVVITAVDRLSALPDYLESYLLSTNPYPDREQLADEGERMMREGITEADIAMAADPNSAIHMSSAEDLVDSLRRRGFTDFPTRTEYYRRLAWQVANTSDFRRWWTNKDIADYWREFPEQASQDWYAFAGKKYTEAKEEENAKWLEAFRRIDAAAGVVNAIAVVTIGVAGSFLGGPAIAGGARGIAGGVRGLAGGMRALQGVTFQGVPIPVWLTTFGFATLSANYLNAIVTRSEEAVRHGDANPLAIVAAAFNDALGSGKIYEAVTNESLLTGMGLNMSTSERVIGWVTGGLELGFNFLSAKDLFPEPVPMVKAPTKSPTPAASKTPEPQVPAPWTADELAAMQEQGIPSLTQYKAAREAEALKAAQEQQSLNIVAQQETHVVQMAAGGSSGSRTPPVQTVATTSDTASSAVGGTARGPSVFKRKGPSGERRAYEPDAAARAESGEAEDLAESLEALKSRDPGQEGKLIQGEFAPENVQRGRTIRTTEYDPTVGDSALLGKNLRKAGFKPSGPDDQAHHMIPSNEPMADQVRNFVMERGFKDINDVDNGVWLPTSREAPNIGAAYKHEFTFDNPQFRGEYFHRLEDIFMVEGITQKGIRLRLRLLRESLLRGELPSAESFANLPL
ncbi:eCIS core domain-containing protein [Mycolicibacterium celeriflavum]|uniref:eCIS core domain-containing protein n=1 Tax=Mycolicibacterium celeriflavum TaxID=1249101 RepID=UPI003CF4FF9D